MPSPFRQSRVLQSSAICVQTVLDHPIRAFPREEVSGRLGMIARERRQVESRLNFVTVAPGSLEAWFAEETQRSDVGELGGEVGLGMTHAQGPLQT